MTDSLLILCLGLTVVAGGVKYRIRLDLSRFRKEIAALKVQRLKAAARLRQTEEELAYAELRERELTNDCRDLSRQLQETQGKLRELEELAESRAKNRPRPAAAE